MNFPALKKLVERATCKGATLSQLSEIPCYQAEESNLIVCFDSNIVNKEIATSVAISIVSAVSMASKTASGGVA
jgi:hypothetical protein